LHANEHRADAYQHASNEDRNEVAVHGPVPSVRSSATLPTRAVSAAVVVPNRTTATLVVA
jgi:hypothetical protein